ncbi:hypothetical protein GGR51DRAFT_566019 [Nemania sp. FL0031]|nr:hypothetical protein GGR51DRAFT_566019 [Nemania sp. FL0031]
MAVSVPLVNAQTGEVLIRGLRLFLLHFLYIFHFFYSTLFRIQDTLFDLFIININGSTPLPNLKSAEEDILAEINTVKKDLNSVKEDLKSIIEELKSTREDLTTKIDTLEKFLKLTSDTWEAAI